MQRPLRLTALLGSVMLLPIAQAQPTLEDSPPQLLHQAEAEYPAQLREQRIVGSADLVFHINEEGKVDKVMIDHDTRNEFSDAAAAAALKFQYRPALKAGQPYAVNVRQVFEFNLSEKDLATLEEQRTKEVLPPGPPIVPIDDVTEWPRLRKEIKPATPPGLRANRQIGQAVMGLVVDEQGMPRDIHLIVTSHSECVEPARRAIQQWKFTPGKKDGSPVRVALEVPIVFFPESSGSSGLRVRPGVRGEFTAQIKAATPDTVSTPAKPVKQRPIEFPEEMAVRGRTGEVDVEFIINKQGIVTHVKSTGETNQFFAALAERAVSYWEFKPATIDGIPVACHARQKMVFKY